MGNFKGDPAEHPDVRFEIMSGPSIHPAGLATKVLSTFAGTILLLFTCGESAGQISQQVTATQLGLTPPDPVSQQQRLARGRRFNTGSFLPPLGSLPPGAFREPSIVTLRPMQKLPVDASDAVIIGTIASKAPYLSEDQTALYTEYSVRVREYLKRLKHVPIADTIAVLRPGFEGPVVLRTGATVLDRVKGYGIPLEAGKTYVLFGEYSAQESALQAPKAWELREGHAYPLALDDLARVRSGRPEDNLPVTEQQLIANIRALLPR